MAKVDGSHSDTRRAGSSVSGSPWFVRFRGHFSPAISGPIQSGPADEFKPSRGKTLAGNLVESVSRRPIQFQGLPTCLVGVDSPLWKRKISKLGLRRIGIGLFRTRWSGYRAS